MKIEPILSLVVCTLLALGMLACGASGGDSEKQSYVHSAPLAALPKIETKDDPDEDSDKYPTEPDRDEVPYYKTEPFGRPADSADARATASLVKRYYADAAHGDAAAACRLLYAPRAEGMADEGNESSLGSNRPGVGCAAVLSRLFAEQRMMLRTDDATLKMGPVRTEYNAASVQMYFGHPRVAYYIEAHRERGVWKLEMLVALDRPVGVE